MKTHRFRKSSQTPSSWIAALILMLLVSISAAAQTNAALQRGKSLLDNKDFAGAVNVGLEATKANPQDAEAWLLLGRALYETRKFDESVTALTKVESLTQDHRSLMETNYWLGILYLINMGELEKAQQCFQKEILHAREVGDRSDEARAHFNLGRVLRRKRMRGDAEDARKEYAEAVRLESREEINLPYRTALAEELYLINHTGEALLMLQAIEEEAGKTQNAEVKARTLFACGKLYTRIGEYKRKSDVPTERNQAARYFEKANDKLIQGFKALRAGKRGDASTEAYAFELLGKLVEIQGNIKAAIGRYQQALEQAKQAGHQSEALANDLNTHIAALTPLAKQEYIFGAIDIGSKGVKAVLITSIWSNSKGKGLLASKTELYRRTINTDLNATRDANGNFSAAAMKKTAVAVHDMIREMKAVRKPPFRVTSFFVAGSSSLAQAPNRPVLAQLIFEETKNEEQAPASLPNAIVETATLFVNNSDELLYGIRGSIDPEDRENAILVDIGSGNGRWGYVHNDVDGETPVSLEIPLGSVTMAAAAQENKKAGEEYTAALEREADQEIGDTLRKQMKRNTVFTQRKKVYIIGGAAYALATLMHPEGAKNDEVYLTLQDLLGFYDRVKSGSAANPYRPDTSKIADTDTLELAKKQIDDVLLKVFPTREQLLSAAILLKTLAANALNSEQVLVFPRNGGWALGMAEYKYFADQAKAEADKLKATDAR